MKNKIIAILLMILSVITVGCASNNDVINLTLDDVIESVNEKNENFLSKQATYDEAEYMINFENDKLSDDEIKTLSTYDYKNITKDEAKEDVDMLFRFLKSYYSGYTYFGGDKAFDEAKKDIKASIDSYEKNKINPQELSEMIKADLSFVKDSHFRILGDQCFDEAHTYYESSKMEFRKSENGYITVRNDENWLLSDDYEKYLKITIGESGELVYGLFAVVTDTEKSELPTEIKLSSGSRTETVATDWTISAVGGDQAKQAKYIEESSVAISALSDMSVTEYNISDINDFLNNSKKHAEHDYSILDLRENDGGSAEIDMMWIYGYTGEIADINYPHIAFLSEIYDKFSMENQVPQDINPFSYFDIANSELENKITQAADQTGVVKINGVFNLTPEKLISNPNTLFVLQSKNNYSSGELFLLMLDNVENVISVGTNTNGCIHTGNVFLIYLPNSSIVVQYSRSIFAGFEKDFEVYGLEPDIYIGDEDAQEAVLRCIEFYRTTK